ncbi:MAG: diguanylate cyclase [Planctomycetes bacterium]|nr:diguanylate cyclase [Planctomycetota bacterium]
MKVLIAEDNNVARHALEAVLNLWGFEVVSTRDGQEAWTALQKDDSLQLAVLDWMMPKMDGIELCRRVRQSNSQRYLYMILLTAKENRESLLQGLNAGADDFLTKPFDPDELEQRLRAGQRIVQLQNELLATQERLRVQATHDPLTGVLNHGAILEVLDCEVERACRNGLPVSLIMADLDHFKRVNDTHGHQIGDRVLRFAAQTISRSIRCYDSVGRYGGEEFVVVLPGAKIDEAEAFAERIRAELAGRTIDVEATRLNVTVSLGVATEDPPAASRADSLVYAADMALYRAKSDGRNCVRRHSQEEASPESA